MVTAIDYKPFEDRKLADSMIKNSLPDDRENTDKPIILNGRNLNIGDVVRVARKGVKIKLTDDPDVVQRVADAHDYIVRAAESGKIIYGVTTGFGGLANTLISPDDAVDLQENLIWFMKSDSGKTLPLADVRAAMVIRANTHLMGFSGLRFELIRRMEYFLNANVTPHVREFGSIGAAGI